MKKILLIAYVLITGMSFLNGQTTATNFTCNDCGGTNHDLFTELNSGKVIVIVWVMPCTSCIGPAQSAYTEVQNYASSNPGQVKYYLCDDAANTSCTTLNTWANANGLSGASAIFSNSGVVESTYGSGGMPKIVVLGGSNHTVFYNQNGPLDVSNFNTAINNALAAAVGIEENTMDHFKLALFPNPITDKKTIVTYNLKSNEEITIEIYNALGAKVKNVLNERQSIGKNDLQIDLSSFTSGSYFIKLRNGNKFNVIKFVIPE